MKTSCLVVVMAFVAQLSLCSGAAVGQSKAHRRTKRTILQMCEMIQAYTGRPCLDFNHYGCFCGWGNAGPGRKHRDGVDQCCRLHDNCYGEVTCMWFYPQLVGYNLSCENGRNCTCQDTRLWSPCARSVCECDIRFADCLGRATYNDHHRNYDWNQCVPH